MTKTKRTILVSLLGTVIGASAILVLANPAAANQLLRGEYIVTQTTTVPAPAFIKFRTSKNGQTTTQHLRCVLPNGLDSPSCFIQQFNLNLDVDLMQEGQYVGRIAVDYLPLEIWADNNGFDVLGIEAEAPVIQKAEAYWTGPYTHWDCYYTSADVASCNDYCGLGGGSVEASPLGVHNSPLDEPACEVTCDCHGETDDTSWIDPPEVLPG
jgi:hypothetical protein